MLRAGVKEMWCLMYVHMFAVISTRLVNGMRVTGSWSTKNGRISVLAKFGFQQTDPLETKNKHSRGFIYGNVSSEHVYESELLLSMFLSFPLVLLLLVRGLVDFTEGID